MTDLLTPDAASEARSTRRWFAAWRPALLVLAVLSLASGYLLLRTPPMWHAYDGLIQIAMRPNDLTILQYPPLYPALSRAHVMGAQKLDAWWKQTKTKIDLRKTVRLNDAGVQALIVTQHVALLLALTFFVRSVSKEWRVSLLIAAFFVTNIAIFIPAQVITTEALSQSLTVLFVAHGWRILAEPRLSVLSGTLHTLTMLLLVLTRHVNAVLASVVPLACLAAVLHRRIKGGPLWSPYAARALLVSGLGVVAILGGDLVTRGVCRMFDVTYRETGMRGPAEKLGFVNLMPPAERAAFLAGLQAKATDPVVREAIPLLAVETGWTYQRPKIEAILRRERPELEGERLEVEADAYLGRVVAAFYGSRSRYLFQDTANSIWQSLAHSNAPDIAEYCIADALKSIAVYPGEPFAARATGHLVSCSPAAKERLLSFRSVPWMKLWAWAPHGLILLVSFAVALCVLISGKGDALRALFALACSVTGVLATVLIFSFVRFEARFGALANLLGFLALALLISAIVEPILERRRANVEA